MNLIFNKFCIVLCLVLSHFLWSCQSGKPQSKLNKQERPMSGVHRAPRAQAEPLPKAEHVLVLDFDYTMIPIHCNGKPIECEGILFPDVDKTKSLLTKLLNRFSHIYICTRGLVDQTKSVLKADGLLGYFTDVYGAETEEERVDPAVDLSIQKTVWAQKKSDFLEKIYVDRELKDKKFIVFYDDTFINIKTARENGFLNSHNNILGYGETNYGNKLLQNILDGESAEKPGGPKSIWKQF